MADNPFYVQPVNPLQALMLGQQSYEGARQRTREDEMRAGRLEAMQSLQQGGDLRGPLAKLLGIGDVQGAKALAEFAHNQATIGHQGATLAEQKRFHDAQVANMEAQRRAEEGRLGLAQRAADQPIYKQGEEDPETGTRPWLMIPKGGTGMPEIIRPRGAEGPPGMTPAGPGPTPVAPGSPNLPTSNTVPYAAINPTPIAQQGIPAQPAPVAPQQVAQAAPQQMGPAGVPLGTAPPPPKWPIGVNQREARKAFSVKQAQDIQDEPQQRSAALSTIQNFDSLIDQAKEIKTLGGEPGKFPGQKRIERVTGMSSFAWPMLADPDLQSKIENIKNRMSGASLQNMRDSSKSGGAVGSVTEREWPRLEHLAGNVVQAQSPQAFFKSLDDLIKFTEASKGRVQHAYEQTHNKDLFPKNAAPAAQGGQGQVIPWQTYFGGGQ